jgi:hypothetical protein
VFLSLAVVAIVGAAAGCKSTAPVQGSSQKTPYQKYQDKAAAISAAGGLAAVGIGQSSVVSLALEKAKNAARAEIAHTIQTKVDSLRKSFQEEVGEGQGSEVNALFSAASKSFTSQELHGTVVRDSEFVSEGGQTMAYVLMVQDPKVVADAFAAQANTQRALYTRFRASQAFGELDAEVKKYEEFKKKDSAVAQP